MEAQVVRDSLLHLGGRPRHLTVWDRSLDPRRLRAPTQPLLKHSRDQQDKFLKTFDDADHRGSVTAERKVSQPQQALALSAMAGSRISMAQRLIAGNNTSQRNSMETGLHRIGRLGRKPCSHVTAQRSRAGCQSALEALTMARDAGTLISPEATQRARRGTSCTPCFNHNDFVS